MRNTVVILTVLLIGLSTFVSARDITLKNGKTFKNIKIYTVFPNGMDIKFQRDGNTVIKHIYFRDCTKKVQEEFHYNRRRAEAYERHIQHIYERQSKLHEEEVKRDKKINAEKHYRDARVEGGSMNVILKVIGPRPGGCLAWAVLPNATVTTGHLGKVFMLGMDGQNGESWAGRIYPTGMSREGYPCYTKSFDMAVGYMEATGK